MFWKRMAEQVALAFLVGFLPVFSFSDMSTARSAAIAGAVAAGRFIYGVLVKYIGDPESPSVK